MKALYSEMDRVSKEQHEKDSAVVIPAIFVHVLRQAFPQFNTLNERGHHEQQDANECFTELLRMISDELAFTPEKLDGR